MVARVDQQLKPGQLWRWKQILNYSSPTNNEIWPLTIVTEEARSLPTIGCVLMRPKDALLMVSPDDPGPYEMPDFDPKTYTMVARKRYHVVLVQGVLAWVRHDWLTEGAELVQDVE